MREKLNSQKKGTAVISQGDHGLALNRKSQLEFSRGLQTMLLYM